MIHIYYKKKRLWWITAIITLLFLLSIFSAFYYWLEDSYIDSKLLKFPFGLSLISFPVSMFWISLIFFMILAFALFLVFRMLLHRKPAVIINDQGIIIKDLPVIPWSDIETAKVSVVQGQKFVEIRMKNFRDYKNTLPWYARIPFELSSLMGDYHVTLPNTLAMSNEDIIEIINQH